MKNAKKKEETKQAEKPFTKQDVILIKKVFELARKATYTDPKELQELLNYEKEFGSKMLPLVQGVKMVPVKK